MSLASGKVLHGRLDPRKAWAREEAAARRRALEDKLAQQIRAWGLATPDREYRTP